MQLAMIGLGRMGGNMVQRLLQGDVGSGKTVVAVSALLCAVQGGHQGALMAPTETLAEQHFFTVEGLCAELGVRVALLTSSRRMRVSADHCTTVSRMSASKTKTCLSRAMPPNSAEMASRASPKLRCRIETRMVLEPPDVCRE